MSLEGTQHIDSNYWDEGQDNSGPPRSSSKIGGGRHDRTRDLLEICFFPTWTLGCAGHLGKT